MSPPAGLATSAAARPWRHGLLWLVFLGPFFFASYGFANWAAGLRTDVGVVVFAWERHIPFVPWTIVPYWLIDLFYAASLLLLGTRREIDTHARRLLAIQLVAIACFLAFPLRFSFERPEAEGLPGALFVLLGSFDAPYNQAPSLHIALLVALWVAYRRVVPRGWSWVVHALALLIGVSVLTTWQHHFVDLPTGLWLGWFCVWLFPDDGRSPLAGCLLARDPARRSLALRYGTLAVFTTAAAFAGGGAWLWFLWGAAALALVAVVYAVAGEAGFQKRPTGRMSEAAWWLLWPYFLGARLNAWWWTRRTASADAVLPALLLGRLPAPGTSFHEAARIGGHTKLPSPLGRGVGGEGRNAAMTSLDSHRHRDRTASLPDGIAAVVDLTAELPARLPPEAYRCVPMLDLVPPLPAQIERACDALDEALRVGPVLLCCALGYSRSALVAAAWLLRSGACASPQEAIAHVRRARPAVVLGPAFVAALGRWHAGTAAEHVPQGTPPGATAATPAAQPR